jgi:hypothetical protein
MRLTRCQSVSALTRIRPIYQAVCDVVRHIAKVCNALTRTFNPKVPGSRPGRPTSDAQFRKLVSTLSTPYDVGTAPAMSSTWTFAPGNDPSKVASPKVNTPPSEPKSR